MRHIAAWTSLATIVTLNVVLGLGMIGGDTVPSSSDALLYGRVLTALHVLLPISSVLMFWLLAKDGQWAGAALFAAVIVGMLGVVMLRLTGTRLSLGVHLATDLCALNIYLIGVPWYWSNLRGRGQRSRLLKN